MDHHPLPPTLCGWVLGHPLSCPCPIVWLCPLPLEGAGMLVWGGVNPVCASYLMSSSAGPMHMWESVIALWVCLYPRELDISYQVRIMAGWDRRKVRKVFPGSWTRLLNFHFAFIKLCCWPWQLLIWKSAWKQTNFTLATSLCFYFYLFFKYFFIV